MHNLTENSETLSDNVTLWTCPLQGADLKWVLKVDGADFASSRIPADDDDSHWALAFRCAAKCGISKADMNNALNNALGAFSL